MRLIDLEGCKPQFVSLSGAMHGLLWSGEEGSLNFSNTYLVGQPLENAAPLPDWPGLRLALQNLNKGDFDGAITIREVFLTVYYCLNGQQIRTTSIIAGDNLLDDHIEGIDDEIICPK